MKKIIFTVGMLMSHYCIASGHAEGTINKIFVNEYGAIALTLNEGFDSALVSSECPAANGYAGHSDPDPAM